MKKRIENKLEELAESKGIRILMACETGSRAWGFASPDSDFDVRFIYTKEEDWYLSLSEKRDTIEYMSEDKELDLTGWDIRKALRLLHKSNPPLLERAQSPILYREENGFRDEFLELAKTSYSPISTLYHYLGMAKKAYLEIEGKGEIKLKRLFYALRAAMACRWIFEKEEMPPIEFRKMLDGLIWAARELPLLGRVHELMAIKAEASESYMHAAEPLINAFIEAEISRAIEKGNDLP
ncbi:MAG: nucleotidyltransferase domain-containing protein, partial [Bacteroidota bacterium]